MPTTKRDAFWANVQKTDGCWLWTAGTAAGYGQLVVGKRRIGAHRYAYILARGPIPNGRMVCHRCDTPLCVNPDHLFLGSAKDNAADMANKGRARGKWTEYASRSACSRGHPYVAGSYTMKERSTQKPHRHCLICERERWHSAGKFRPRRSL